MPETHKLGKIVYRAEFDTEPPAYEFQGKASRFIQVELAGVVNEVCNALDHKGQVIYINKLELDLGRFPPHHGEAEIKEKFRDELYNILREKIISLSHEPSENGKIIPEEKSDYAHLIYYLQKGSLSWNGSCKNSREMEKALGRALDINTDEFVNWIKQHGNQETIRKRMAYQFTDPYVIKTIEKLDASNAPFITEYAGHLKKTHKKKPLVSASENEFRDITWEVILAYVLSDRGSRFNRKSFVNHTLGQIAARKNIPYAELLHAFSHQIPELLKNQHLKSEFSDILSELNKEHTHAKEKEPEEQRENRENKIKQHRINEMLLALQGKRKSLSLSALKFLADKYPAELIRELHSFVLNTTDRENSLNLFTEKHCRIIIGILDSAEKNFIFEFARILESWEDMAGCKPSNAATGKTKWQSMLLYLLENKGSACNRKNLIKNTLTETACRNNLCCLKITEAVFYRLSRGGNMPKTPETMLSVIRALRDELRAENQIRKTPDEHILQQLHAAEGYEEIIFYLHKGYLKTNSLAKHKANGIITLLTELNTASPALTLKFSGYLRNKKHLNLLLNLADEAFIEETISMLLTRYYPSSAHQINSLKQNIRQNAALARNKRAYHTALIEKLIIQTGNDAAKTIQECNTLEESGNTGPSGPANTLPALQARLMTLLQEKKDNSGINLEYKAVWHDLIEHHPDQTGGILKSIMSRPGLSASLIKKSDHGLLLRILKSSASSPFMRNFAVCFTESFGLGQHACPDQLKKSLWQIVFQSVTGSMTKSEAEAGTDLLTRAVRAVNEPEYVKKSLRALKEQTESFQSTDKEKASAFIRKAEAMTTIPSLHPLPPLPHHWEIREKALALLKGEKTGTVSANELIENTARFLKENPEQASDIISGCLPRKKTRQLWISLFPESLLTRFVFLLAPREFLTLNTMSEIIWNASAAAAFGCEIKTEPSKWHCIFETLATCRTHYNPTYYGNKFIGQILSNVPDHRKKIFLEEVCLELKRKTEPSNKEIHTEILTKIHEIVQNMPAGEENKTDKKSNQSVQTDASAETPVRKENGKGEPRYITNAGLVLTAPFIPHLFTRLKWTQANQFTDIQNAERAIHLLQYMVDKSTSSPEFLLLLNKILCGTEQEKPVPKDVMITTKEKETADQLIENLIRHWKAIQNSTPEGFRTSFLQREGTLRDNKEGWELQVESRSFDMLIDQIPWTFSTIKYPWMNSPLYVKWR